MGKCKQLRATAQVLTLGLLGLSGLATYMLHGQRPALSLLQAYAGVNLAAMPTLYFLCGRRKIHTSHAVMSAMLGVANAFLVFLPLVSYKADLLLPCSTFSVHFSLLYFFAAAVLQLRGVPGIQPLAAEIAPGTHLDIKAAYLFLNFAIYAVHSYAMHFINKQWELPIADYGYVSAMGIFYTSNIAFGALADRWRATKPMLITMMVVSTAIYSMFKLPPSVITFGKWEVVAVCSLYNVTVSPVFPLFDVLVMSHLEREHPSISAEERKGVFSRIRLWASFGHAAIGLLISYVSNTTGAARSAKSEDYSKNFDVLLGFLVISSAVFCLLTYFRVPSNHQGDAGSLQVVGEGGKKRRHSGAKISDIAHLLGSFDFAFFLFVVTCIGVTRTTSSCFLVSYMATYFGQDFTKVTTIMCVRTISEILILYYGKSLLKLYGYHWLLFMSLACATLRELCYGLIPRGDYVFVLSMAVEILKGVSAACLVFSGVHIADTLSAGKTRNLAQSLFSSFYNGVSVLLSSVLSIVVAHTLEDFRSLFLATACVGFGGLSAIVIKYGLVDGLMPFRSK